MILTSPFSMGLPVTTTLNDVRTDELGVMRVGESKVMLDSVIAAYQQGHSAETIQQQYPALLLADVYGAIAYYLRHRDEVDRYLRVQAAIWSQSRDEWNLRSGALVQRLRDSQLSPFTASTNISLKVSIAENPQSNSSAFGIWECKHDQTRKF